MHPSEVFVDAVVLHSRPYQEDSALCELFTAQYGRVAGVVKKVRGPKSTKKSLIQPFQGISVKWCGRGELKSFTQLEAQPELSVFLQGKAALCGLYINELMVRLLTHFDPYPKLFGHYVRCLFELKDADNVELPLRVFENALLQALGYAPDWSCHSHTGAPLVASEWYLFDPLQGIIDAPSSPGSSVDLALPPEVTGRSEAGQFMGASLIAVAAGDYSEQGTLRDAKRLMRMALGAQLGDKPLLSRMLFV
ncbi:MAG: DNA repair protein RecO [Gammaproteobacteria bacterium]|nr:MAG: DNA repair protein RecO [Gammaproteobacteria bacterium]